MELSTIYGLINILYSLNIKIKNFIDFKKINE